MFVSFFFAEISKLTEDFIFNYSVQLVFRYGFCYVAAERKMANFW